MSREAPRSESAPISAPVASSIVKGAAVPQNPHTSICRAGFHSAWAPQAAHGYFSRAPTVRGSTYLARYSSSAARLMR